MIFLTGCFFSCSFPSMHDLQARSLAKLTFVSPMTCSPLRSVCKDLIFTWASLRCQSHPTSTLAIRHMAVLVGTFGKSTTYIPSSTCPTKATLRVFLHIKVNMYLSKKVQRPIMES